MSRSTRTILAAGAVIASLGGGIGVSHATGVGPAAAHFDVKSATWYADHAVQAWGVGDSGRASQYLTSGTSRALFGWRYSGGGGWMRTGVTSASGKTYVSYRDARSGARIQLTVNNAARSRTNRVVTYVNWWEGQPSPAGVSRKGSGTTQGTTNPAPTGPWVATTQGLGPVTLGASLRDLESKGLVRNVRHCGADAAADARGNIVRFRNGRVDSIELTTASTRSGISVGSSEASLKRTYGGYLIDLGMAEGGIHLYILPWSDGNSLSFLVDNGRVGQIVAAPGDANANIIGAGPSC